MKRRSKSSVASMMKTGKGHSGSGGIRPHPGGTPQIGQRSAQVQKDEKTGSGSTSDDPRSEADETVEPRMNLMKQQPLFFFVRFRGTFVERSFKLREALSFQ
ncbi:MAG: hypothetical protein ACLVJ6_05000 [Merdibacter sp.]